MDRDYVIISEHRAKYYANIEILCLTQHRRNKVVQFYICFQTQYLPLCHQSVMMNVIWFCHILYREFPIHQVAGPSDVDSVWTPTDLLHNSKLECYNTLWQTSYKDPSTTTVYTYKYKYIYNMSFVKCIFLWHATRCPLVKLMLVHNHWRRQINSSYCLSRCANFWLMPGRSGCCVIIASYI